ncbi:helix-turn-helix transcriptional regulator [Vibrio genomosp. F10]|uniref:helix-turn-helix transcriptional regulator n=1 Tax=Vibrio genomosp. F10 TaxID=723171 RepID=UPI00031043EF|nr:helix-turn-helix transcriptional regulator [Vibrio genomosp. F10]
MRSFTFIMRIVDTIECLLPKKLDVAMLSQTLNVSRWHLQHEFKRYTGMSVGHYYRARLLSLAVKEIADTDKRLLDIALDFGFDSHEAFYRAFKKQFHVSPKHLKSAPHFADFLVITPISTHYLEFVEEIAVNPPYRSHFKRIEVHGVPEVFPSISNSGEEFKRPLGRLWSEFDSATKRWNHQNRQYFTLEYRNNCSYLSGLFQMLAACDGPNEESEHVLTKVILPARSVWNFQVRNIDYIAPFFKYLELVFMPAHQLFVKALPIVWQQRPDGSLICSIELLAQQVSALPSSVTHLSKKLVMLSAHFGHLTRYTVGSHCVLKAYRLADIVAHFIGNIEAINQGKGAILIGQHDEQGVFSPQHDYDCAYFEFSKTGSEVSQASYLQCKLEGTVKDIGDALESLYCHYLVESPFYLVRGYEWITSLKPLDDHGLGSVNAQVNGGGPFSEDQKWTMELLIPAKKR